MALVKIQDYNSNYRDEIFGGKKVKGYSVYADAGNDKVGSVHDILVDETGRLRYFVLDTGFWIFGKKVLLPVGYASIDYHQERLYATGFTKEQAEALPRYDDDTVIDHDYEERVRASYRQPDYKPTTAYDRNSYRYDYDPDLYGVNEDKHGVIKLYEERLIADKKSHKTGDVSVGKRVETETARASVPVQKEQVVIERRNPTNTEPVSPQEANFREGEVARMEVHEETAEIRKEAFVAEEVSVKKTVEQDTVTAQEKLRREELEVDTNGNPVIKTNR